MSKRLTKGYFEELCATRNHRLICFDNYSGVKSKLSFECLNCGHNWTASAASYMNSKSGCWGCKKSKISSIQRGKLVSSKTRNALSVKAQQRTDYWYQLSPENWYREDTLYLVLLNWNGEDVVKVGRSLKGSNYHKGRLKHVFGEWKAPSFWVWWVEKIIKQIFYEYRYTNKNKCPENLKSLPGYSECFIPELEVHRLILAIESLITRQSAGKP
jgi:hypothetical protein